MPPYTGNSLGGFQSLYDYVKQVWWMKNYDKDSKKPLLTNYRELEFDNLELNINLASRHLDRLNHQGKHPDKIFLWQHLPEQNQQLWSSCANCLEPTSICLGAISRRTALKSPFLNETVGELDDFTIIDRLNNDRDRELQSKFTRRRSLSELITQKARNDLELTRQYAVKVSSWREELVDRVTQKFDRHCEDRQTTSILSEENSFGLTTKSPNSNPQKWF